MSRFVKDFDPTKKEHVTWLKKMVKTDAMHYVDTLKENPMGMEITQRDILEWAQTVFVLCTKYTKALFDNPKEIYVPQE